MEQLAPATPDCVRDTIARGWLLASKGDTVLGRVTLRPHQVDAVSRLRSLLSTDGGALLCDEVGLGKTYVALAVARTYSRPLVVAPACLRDMWATAADAAGVTVGCVTTESLSRGDGGKRDADLVIVDEAHHFRTPSTARYRRLAKICARSRILLVSATPSHNSSRDVTALLALFLGSAACSLPNTAVARLVVRRAQNQLLGFLPAISPPRHVAIPARTTPLHDLLALPWSTPARDAGLADALVAHNLVRLWASSDAALREGLRRRLARTISIRQALEAGRHPTRAELRAWVYGEGAVQLGFATLLSVSEHEVPAEMLSAVCAHEHALSELIARHAGESASDRARVLKLRAIRARHAGARLLAFSGFSQTVTMYYRALARDGRVAMLTSRGGRIASGPMKRRELLERFAPVAHGVRPPPRAEEITLLLTTDLLSEGVNLQDASVVVHLDLPWTAATVEQRVGRAARLGSRNSEVFVYCFDPPASSEELLRAESIIRAKAALAEASVGASRIPPLFARAAAPPSAVEDAEAIRRALAQWITDSADTTSCAFACAAAQRDGIVALLSVRGEPVLVAGLEGRISADSRIVRETLELATGPPLCTEPRRVDAVVRGLHSWIEAKLASSDAGSPDGSRSALARRLSTRLARDLADCPSHERPLRATRIAALRHRMQAPFTLGLERELEQLLSSGDAGDFVTALEEIVQPQVNAGTDGKTGVRAVLILQAEHG